MVSKVLDNVGEVMVLGGEEPPVEVRRLVEMLCDFNMTRDEVDIAMRAVVPEWEMGMATSCMRKYPLLAQTVAEGKALALRKAGADKVASIKKYVEAQGAERSIAWNVFLKVRPAGPGPRGGPRRFRPVPLGSAVPE